MRTRGRTSARAQERAMRRVPSILLVRIFSSLDFVQRPAAMGSPAR